MYLSAMIRAEVAICIAEGKKRQVSHVSRWEIDRRAIEEHGLPAEPDEAASAFAASVVAEVKPQGQIVVVTGAGNNGGDGWGIARHLAARSLPVKVVTAISPEELQGDAALQFQVYASLDLPWEEYQGPGQLAGGEVIVDALLGTGLRVRSGKAAEIIAAINAAAGKVVAWISSGLPAEFVPRRCCCPADATATFARQGRLPYCRRPSGSGRFALTPLPAGGTAAGHRPGVK